MAKPGRHPLPPMGGFTGTLVTRRIGKSQTWLRLHRAQYEPLYFGTARRGRFDAAEGEFGILYVAHQLTGAFIETLLRDGVRELTENRINSYHVAEITASRGLRLVNLTGSGLIRMGVDGRLNSGDYRIAQRWSSAFHHHPDGADGIRYPSRHDPSQTLAALFDRTSPLLSCQSCGTVRDYLGDRAFFNLLDHYDIVLM